MIYSRLDDVVLRLRIRSGRFFLDIAASCTRTFFRDHFETMCAHSRLLCTSPKKIDASSPEVNLTPCMFFVLHVLELDDPLLHTVSPRQEHIVLASTQVLDKHCSWTDDGIRDVRKMPGKSRR